MKAFAIALFLLFSITLQDSWAVSPENCDATEPLAGKVLDLINKGRRNGYLFQLLRVADAHLDKTESRAVYYLVLDVQESDCSVLSRKHWDDCKPDVSQRPSEIVIGQCKVIATTCSTDYQDLRVKNFNCTTSSVSSALTNTKDSPALLDFFEDTHLYREQADKALEKFKGENADFVHFRVDRVERVARARGGEGTKYYVDFSVRNCSGYHSPRHFNAFGFCRADLSYNVEAPDLGSPIDIVINCEVFNLEEHRNTSGMHRLWGHHPFFGGHKHHPPGQSPFKPNESGNHHHFHKSHKPRSFHNHSSSGQSPHGHGPHGHGPHGHGPPEHGPPGHGTHGHGSHGHGPHGHSPPGHGPHGNGPPGHGTHGHGPRRHRPHGHHGRRPHHHPHGPDFHDFGPCDPPHPPPSHGTPPPGHGTPPPDHGHRYSGHGPPPPGHGPPPRHSEERGLDKGHLSFERRQIGYVYQSPPLEIGEVLPSPEANFPIFSMPNHNPQKPEIQPFPQSVSESCPGKFKSEFPQVFKFFGYTSPK